MTLVAPDTSNKTVARRVIAAALPDLSLTKLRLLLASEEFDTWEAGRSVVKLPKSKTFEAKLTVEAAVHEAVAAKLGAMAPALQAVGKPTKEFPYRFSVYERARGRLGQSFEGPIIKPKPWAKNSLAKEVAGALTALHSVPARAARSAGVPKRPVGLEPHVNVGPKAISWAHRVAGAAVDAFLVDPLPTHARSAGAQVLCHGDLKGEHIFVSEDGTRLMAFVDWADMVISDPALDLAGLAIWLGPSFVRDVLAKYKGPADDGTFDRAMFLARAGLLGYLDQVIAGEIAASKPLLDAQLRAAFADD